MDSVVQEMQTRLNARSAELGRITQQNLTTVKRLERHVLVAEASLSMIDLILYNDALSNDQVIERIEEELKIWRDRRSSR